MLSRSLHRGQFWHDNRASRVPNLAGRAVRAAPLPMPMSCAKIGAPCWTPQTMRIRLKAGPIILLLAFALAACSGAVVTPNRTNPAFIGTYGPGGSGWH
jgi:hypothetical protein